MTFIFLFQELFEKLFSPYGGDEKSFIYLKTFHRARVTFNKEENAKEAKKDLHGQLFLGYELGVFLVQVIIHIFEFLGYRKTIFVFSAMFAQQCNNYITIV